MTTSPDLCPTVLVEQFIDAKAAAGLSPRTIQTYRQRLGYFTAWLCDRDITRPVLRGYLTHLREQQLSATSRASYFRDVSVFCNWLVDERIWDASPAYKLGPRVPKTRPASYRPEQIAALLAVCKTRDRALIVMLLDTGLRVSELVSLRRRDIDWIDGSFVVTGKGNKPREAWLEPYTVELLREMLAKRDDENPALWMGRKGPLTIWGVHQVIERRAKEAGIRLSVRRLVHSFRVTFAVSYVRQGGDLGTLAALMGHSTLTMAQHYSQLATDQLAEKKRAVNPLAAVVPESRLAP